MKITANLLSRPPASALPLAVGLWTIGLGLIAAAWQIADDTAHRRQEAQTLQTRLVQLSEQLHAAAAETKPVSREELAALRTRVNALNALSTTRGMGTSQLLAWFESRMANDVRLVSLDHKARDGEVLLVAESRNAQSLTVLLGSIENEPRFSEVLLSKQGVRNGQGETVSRVEVRIRQAP